MTALAPARKLWIDEACRLFSDATGWPIVFRTEDELSPEQTLPQEALFSQCHRGALCLDRPEGFEKDPNWPAVWHLTFLLSEFINRVLQLEFPRRRERDFCRRMKTIARELARRSPTENAIPRLLDLALEIAEMDGSAFYLLDAREPRLNLKAIASRSDLPLSPRPRSLSEEGPDLRTLVKGAVQIFADDHPDNADWLPRGWKQGVCLPIRVGSEPIGTFWCFRRAARPLHRSILELLSMLGGLIAGELERVALLDESEDRLRLRKEIHAASTAHNGFAPKVADHETSLRIARRVESREVIGGDLAEAIALDETHSVILLGDATGDSIPAALIRARVEGAMQYVLQMPPEQLQETSAVMRHLNRTLSKLFEGDQFFSLFLGVWNRETRHLTCTNAGHPTPFLILDGAVKEIPSHGMLLGILDDSDYRESTFRMEEGDQLVLYTDGISEAISHSHFGSIRHLVRDLFQKQRGISEERILEFLWETAELHTRSEDDRSVLAVGF